VAETHELSRTAFERLKDELEYLQTHGRVEVAQRIELAREHGDISENADYDAAKDEQAKMEARIRQIQSILQNAVVVDGAPDGGRVSTGCVVAIRYAGDDSVERYLIGSIEERHGEYEVISPGSPLGQALLGASPGDQVKYEAPSGVLTVEVVAVEG
jgi:transcription elongation factor GreA